MGTSIARRIQHSLLGLVLGLSVIFSGLALMLLYTTEDQIFVNQLRVERAILEETPAGERDAWIPGNRHMSVVWDIAALPQRLRNVVGAAPGIYEQFDDKNAAFILKGRLMSPDRDYYLTFDVSQLLAVRHSRPTYLWVFGFGLMVIVAAAVLVALYLARNTLRPLRRLTDRLASDVGDELPSNFSAAFEDDEIGVLAKALELALARAQASANREFEFNRGMSHELRTPIQVAKGALELIAASGEPVTPGSRPVARLERAVTQMENLTEAFLWLASGRTVSGTETHAPTAIKILLADHRHLLAERSVELTVEVDDINYAVPLPVFSVLIGNLLRNAIQYTTDGTVRCRMSAHRVLIENSCLSGEPHEADRGFGVGLEIVKRICERLGWRLAVGAAGDEVMRVSIALPVERAGPH